MHKLNTSGFNLLFYWELHDNSRVGVGGWNTVFPRKLINKRNRINNTFKAIYASYVIVDFVSKICIFDSISIIRKCIAMT